MRQVRLAMGLCSLLIPMCAAGQSGLTLEHALERARTRAPLILAAQDRIEEARGRLAGASVRFQANPSLDGAIGRRMAAGGGTTDAEIGISQGFELGGRRAARIAAAQAAIDQASASAGNVLRRLLADVAQAHARALAAQQQVAVALAADEVNSMLLQTMERRFQAGDVPVLEVNLARSGAARGRAELRRAEAELVSALGDLRIFLGMSASEPLAVAGELAVRKQFDAAALLAQARERSDLRELAAELRQAEADVQLGRGFGWPELGLGGRYERDEGDNVAKATVSLTLPVFNRGQELRAVGNARATRLRREIEATSRAIEVEVRTALEVYNRKAAAADDLEKNALRTIDDNELLARRSYEEGELSLMELLLIRRENFEIRRLYISSLLEAAFAAIEVQARAGALR